MPAMPDTHRVIITADALSNLESIADYIAIRSPQNAASVAKQVLGAIDSLAFMPDRFRQAGNSKKRGSPVHAMVVRPFIVYYRVDSNPAVVYVLTVKHGSQRQPLRFP
jgi:plasmid stabilization system protein ParE